MFSSSEAKASESLYVKESDKLIKIIGEAIDEAADSVNKFDIKNNSDKICILTVANNFAKDLEYTLNILQRVTIDNHKQGDDNKNLKEAVQAFSTFIHSLQLAFGDDLSKLKLEINNVLQNLVAKLSPLLNIVQEHSPYTSKWEICNILDYLYIAIEKVKLRFQWEHIDHDKLQNAIQDVLDVKLDIISKLNNREDLVPYFRRYSREAVRAIFYFLEESNIDADHCDDKIRNIILNVTAKIADSIFEYDKAIRNKSSISELMLAAQLCTRAVVPSIKPLLDTINDENLQDSSGNIKNFVLNAVINSLGASIRFSRDWQRMLEN